MADEKAPCCTIGARPDAAAIAADLLAEVSFTTIIHRTGVPRVSLSRHRAHVFAAAEAGGTAPEQPGTASEQPAPVKPPIGPSTPYVTARLVEDIAGLISVGKWRDHIHIAGLAVRWALPEAEVQRLHRLAAAKCRANRGALSAQAEASVGVTRELRDDAIAAASEHRKAKREALARRPDPDYAAADAHQRLWAASSKAALDAQKHLDAITLGRAPQKPVQVNVSVTADASFVAAWGMVRRILDARHPGAAEDCETALAAWEDGGDPRVDEWLTEQTEIDAVAAMPPVTH